MTPPSPAWPFLPAPEPAPRLFVSHFDHQRFHAEAWQQAGFECPAPLASAVAKRHAEYLAGRCCAREGLRALGHADTPLAPQPDRQPQWPVQACGAITHSHGLAAAVVAPRRDWAGVGTDAEQWLDGARAERIAPAVLTPREHQALAAIAPEHRARCVTLAFSLKESLFKALYPLTGTRFYFRDAELDPQALLRLREPRGRCRLALLRPLSGAWPAGTHIEGHFAELAGRAMTFIGVSQGV
ncbi:enterobactin synthetase component D [Kushneria sinocarnis]|uniref:Enterobactin synthase component D n=2 Tax=Kushneria sinocarnis TaxID=595502 RepID=A0A420WYY3_9GAMM|nr:enterobactin synthetase component D [Kushneria sinocarnis]